jgi:hypothetical protein
MRIAVLLALAACGVGWAAPQPHTPVDPFELMKSLVGEWQADLAGYGRALLEFSSDLHPYPACRIAPRLRKLEKVTFARGCRPM